MEIAIKGRAIILINSTPLAPLALQLLNSFGTSETELNKLET